jgi:hypothetical protein
MDAHVKSVPLRQTLESLARSTGWRIYLEPDTTRSVSATFTNLSTGAALQRLLGDLNYALLPDTNRSARLFVFRTSAEGATQLIAPPEDSTRPIPNELIVTLTPNAAESIDDIARRLGAKIIGRIGNSNSYRLQFEDESAADRARAALDANDDVESIDSNFRIQIPPQLDPLSSGIVPPLNLRPNVTPNTDHVVIALIDTAILTDHPAIQEFLLPTLSLSGTASTVADQPTHATIIADNMLRALATLPQDAAGTPVRILPIDIYGPNGTTTTFDVALGLEAAVQAGPALINLSLGTPTDSPFLHRFIQQIAQQGPLIIAAAGNEPVTTPVFPAAYPEVIAVTAADHRGQIAPYANHGNFIDLIAPGTAFVEFNNRPYFGSGTSYATAYVTGFTAGLIASYDLSTNDALSHIRNQFALPPADP